MAIQTFTWNINADWRGEEAPKVLSIKFGDTYEQRIGNGINTQPNKFAVTLTYDFTTAKAIRTFLRTHAGVVSFYWTNPYQEQGLYIARDWTFNREETGLYRIETTLEQVFE